MELQHTAWMSRDAVEWQKTSHVSRIAPTTVCSPGATLRWRRIAGSALPIDTTVSSCSETKEYRVLPSWPQSRAASCNARKAGLFATDPPSLSLMFMNLRSPGIEPWSAPP